MPKQVFAFVHSHEVTIDFTKRVHLDHFHYRIGTYFLEQGLNFYLRTYEAGRLVLDYKMNGDQASWVKVTFPRSKVSID